MGKKNRIRIRDEQPGSYFRELRIIFWVKILKFTDVDPGWKNSDPGWKKFGSGINISDQEKAEEDETNVEQDNNEQDDR
jgi:hypothetical protein